MTKLEQGETHNDTRMCAFSTTFSLMSGELDIKMPAKKLLMGFYSIIDLGLKKSALRSRLEPGKRVEIYRFTSAKLYFQFLFIYYFTLPFKRYAKYCFFSLLKSECKDIHNVPKDFCFK